MAYIKSKFDAIQIKEIDCARGKRYFDPVRKIFTPITPEEIVRQRMIVYLQNELGVPLSAMQTEEHLAHHGVKDSKGRMDITVGYRETNEKERIITVVECKESNIPVEDVQQVIDQALGYVKRVGAKYFVLVNGIVMVFYYMEDSEHYRKIEGLLTYNDMLREVHTYAKDPMPFKRHAYWKYQALWVFKMFHVDWYEFTIGQDTPPAIIPCIINFHDCLMDSSVQLPRINSKRFKLVEDLGVQFRKYKNASGSDFGTGNYRVLLVSDKEKDYKFLVGFSLMATGHFNNDPKYGNSDGKSVLMVIYNDGNSDTTIAQINLNKCLSVNGKAKTASLFHNGGMGSRKTGISKSGLLAHIAKESPEMVQNNNVVIGNIDYSHYLTMMNDDVINLVSRLVSYAVYRDEYIYGNEK